MANELFRRQLASYAAVHRDWRNKATHFVGIPLIVFSLMLALSLWRFEVLGREWTGSLLVSMFLVAETMVMMGRRGDLAEAMGEGPSMNRT